MSSEAKIAVLLLLAAGAVYLGLNLASKIPMPI